MCRVRRGLRSGVSDDLQPMYQAQGAEEKKGPVADPVQMRLRGDGGGCDPGAHRTGG